MERLWLHRTVKVLIFVTVLALSVFASWDASVWQAIAIGGALGYVGGHWCAALNIRRRVRGRALAAGFLKLARPIIVPVRQNFRAPEHP